MFRAVYLLLASGLALPAYALLLVKGYGQELVDQVVAKTPGLLVVAMHAPAPNMPGYPIVASNIGRYGKPADEDDMRVINTEKTNLEVVHGGTRFEVELVLRDVTGSNIGALGLVFGYKVGESKAALEKKASEIRDALAKRIMTAASLTEPYPYDPLATTKTHAQKLVDATLAKYPDVIVLAMHVNLPDGQGNSIVASNFGRIGKKADADDMKVIDSGVPAVGVAGDGKRYGVALPLRDMSGKTVGELNVGFRYRSGENEKALLARAEQVRDDLQASIPSVETLIELDP
jgi:hypothetical protein